MSGPRLVGGVLGLLLAWGCAAPESEQRLGSEEIPVEDVGQGLDPGHAQSERGVEVSLLTLVRTHVDKRVDLVQEEVAMGRPVPPGPGGGELQSRGDAHGSGLRVDHGEGPQQRVEIGRRRDAGVRSCSSGG